MAPHLFVGGSIIGDLHGIDVKQKSPLHYQFLMTGLRFEVFYCESILAAAVVAAAADATAAPPLPQLAPMLATLQAAASGRCGWCCSPDTGTSACCHDCAGIVGGIGSCGAGREVVVHWPAPAPPHFVSGFLH